MVASTRVLYAMLSRMENIGSMHLQLVIELMKLSTYIRGSPCPLDSSFTFVDVPVQI